MNNLRLTFLFLILYLFTNVSAIGKNLYYVVYRTQLSSVKLNVDKQEHDKSNYISYRVLGNDTVAVFKDERLEISWNVGLTNLSFILKNSTNETFKIDWNDVAFVDCNNQVGRVIPKGTKYISIDSSLPPSIIPKECELNSFIIPAGNIKMNAAHEWVEIPLIPAYYRSEEALEELSTSYIGKSMQVLYPINIGGKVYEYIFEFTITSIVEKNKINIGSKEFRRIEERIGEKMVK